MGTTASLTERLQLFMQGDTSAVDALLGEVMPKLHQIAIRELKRERFIAPLSKTELIHEIWLTNLSKGGWQIHDSRAQASRRAHSECTQARKAGIGVPRRCCHSQ